jgi:hypothetical protein
MVAIPEFPGRGTGNGDAGGSGLPPRTVDLGVLGGLHRGASRSRGPRKIAPLEPRSQGGIAYTPPEYARIGRGRVYRCVPEASRGRVVD